MIIERFEQKFQHIDRYNLIFFSDFFRTGSFEVKKNPKSNYISILKIQTFWSQKEFSTAFHSIVIVGTESRQLLGNVFIKRLRTTRMEGICRSKFWRIEGLRKHTCKKRIPVFKSQKDKCQTSLRIENLMMIMMKYIM